MTCSLVVSDDRSVWRVIAYKGRIAIGPSPAAFNPLLHGACRNKSGFLRQKIWCQGAQRRDVIHNPYAATVRGQNEIVFARLNCQIADRYGRKVITLELCPVFPAVDRHVKTKLGPKKKQVGFD